MKKLAIVLAAAAVLFVAAAPSADAANKKLWEGWMEDMKKAREAVVARWSVKK
jgi:hypothetical protein